VSHWTRAQKLASGLWKLCAVPGCQGLSYGDLTYCWRHLKWDAGIKATAPADEQRGGAMKPRISKQREVAPRSWRWGEAAAVLHGDDCRGAITLSRSRENGAIDRACCETCGQAWQRPDARWKWQESDR
jgi:hypothetical protein